MVKKDGIWGETGPATKNWVSSPTNSGSTLNTTTSYMKPAPVYVVTNERSGYQVGGPYGSYRGYIIKVADSAQGTYYASLIEDGTKIHVWGTVTLNNYKLEMPMDKKVLGVINPNNYPSDSVNMNNYYPTGICLMGRSSIWGYKHVTQVYNLPISY